MCWRHAQGRFFVMHSRQMPSPEKMFDTLWKNHHRQTPSYQVTNLGYQLWLSLNTCDTILDQWFFYTGSIGCANKIGEGAGMPQYWTWEAVSSGALILAGGNLLPRGNRKWRRERAGRALPSLKCWWTSGSQEGWDLTRGWWISDLFLFFKVI